MKPGTKPGKQTVKKDSRSKGTKKCPTCRFCGKSEHYSASCPALATRLLQAVRKTSGSKQIAEFLEENSAAKIQGLSKKPQRTLKRAKGRRTPNREFSWKQKQALASHKRKKKTESQKQQPTERPEKTAESYEKTLEQSRDHSQSLQSRLQKTIGGPLGLETNKM